jgi:hypothetical protein
MPKLRAEGTVDKEISGYGQRKTVERGKELVLCGL